MNQLLDRIERSAIDVIAVFAPWLGPIPSAYLVGRACVTYLHWHPVIAWIAAIAVEAIGVVSVVLSVRLYDWNDTKNKTDPVAPFHLSVLLVGVYFVVTVGLTVLLDVMPELARFAPAIFPLLAAVGAVNIAVKNGQQRREAAKTERKHTAQRGELTAPRQRSQKGNLPVSQVADWRVLPLVDKQKVATMNTADIQETYGVPERTARNWRKNAERFAASSTGNGHMNGVAK